LFCRCFPVASLSELASVQEETVDKCKRDIDIEGKIKTTTRP